MHSFYPCYFITFTFLIKNSVLDFFYLVDHPSPDGNYKYLQYNGKQLVKV